MKRCFLLLMGLFVAAAASSQAQPRADSSAVEWLQVFFNMPADNSVALPANANNDNRDLMETLETRLDSATYSIDLCIYDLEQPRIGQALVRAKNRGVKVRIITDNHNRMDNPPADAAMWAMLRAADIVSMDDDGDVYLPKGTVLDNDLVNAGADMHNKFAVIDGRNSSPQDDYVWTGSTNLTYTGAFNTNHTIVIKDSGLARAYTAEFEQMWGSNTELPNPQRARFHKDKREIGPHTFYVNDTKIELYFAPINRSGRKPSIVKRLSEVVDEQAQHDVNFVAFAISPAFGLSQTVWQKSATGAIQLNGVIDRQFYGRYENDGAIWASSGARLSNRMILPSNELRKLHHKVMIIDATNPDSADQGVVIAGSYNFSNNAERNNDENLLIIYSDAVANQFSQDFSGIVQRARGERYPPAPPIDTDRWYAVNGEPDDGSEFSIEVVPGFSYTVEPLGAQVPRVYAENDSSDFYADHARRFMRQQLAGAEVQLSGPYQSKPEARYNALQAYVTVRRNGRQFSLNKALLQAGMATYAPYYSQHPDSVAAYKMYARQAKAAAAGRWKWPNKMDAKIARKQLLSRDALSLEAQRPININTATAAQLQLLPGIGSAYAGRILDYRRKRGNFKSIDELRNIDGIGPKTLANMRPYITVKN